MTGWPATFVGQAGPLHTRLAPLPSLSWPTSKGSTRLRATLKILSTSFEPGSITTPKAHSGKPLFTIYWAKEFLTATVRLGLCREKPRLLSLPPGPSAKP
uniref:Uncharacterized protein n=1 Tax=Opuntia streptacantha TaxID=393608 RepID=A0A7C8ZJ46_OPUST